MMIVIRGCVDGGSVTINFIQKAVKIQQQHTFALQRRYAPA